MTYTTDTDASYHRVGFYVAFDGIATRISTHNPDLESGWSPSGTFAATMVRDSLSGFSESLNRESGFVDAGEVSFEVLATAAMDALFVTRGGTDDTLDDAYSKSATTIALADNTLPTTGVVYCDRETFNITGDSGSDRTVTRGYLDSIAAPHAEGAKISTAPTFWFTRRFTLYAVHLDTGTESALFTGTLGSSPAPSDATYTLSGSGVIHDFMKRPLRRGFQEVEASAVTVNSSGDVEFTVPDGPSHFAATGFVRISGDGKSGIYGGFHFGVTQLQVAATTVQVPPSSFCAGTLTHPADLVGKAATLEQVDVVPERPGRAALIAMLSIVGDGANSSDYDLLPGIFADIAGTDENFRDKRMGAGIPLAWVDQATFNLIPSSGKIAAWIDETIDLGDWLTSEVLSRAGGYIYCTGAGVLTFRQYTADDIRGGLTSYTTADVLTSNVTSRDDETGHIGRVTIQCNYQPWNRQYRRKIELVFRDDSAIYGDRGESSSLRSKSIAVGESVGVPGETIGQGSGLFSETTSLLTLETQFDRQRARQTWGGRRMTLMLPWKQHESFAVGYRFKWTDARAADHEGSRGVTERAYEVTGRTLDFGKGNVSVECDEVPRGWLVAPSCFVGSFDGGTNTITIDASGVEADLFDDGNPGYDFAAGWAVTIYDASDNFLTSETLEIDSAPGTKTLAMEADTAFGIAAGDLVVLSQTADKSVTNDVGADVEDFAFAADGNYTVGASSFAGPRWS